VFSLQVHLRNSTPVEQIRQLRASGLSLAEVAERAGTTVAIVRRVAGKLDREAIRRHQEETAQRIDAEDLTWGEKVAKWQEETGQSEATFWRVLQRVKKGGPGSQ
jgi:hypothetical protein